MFHSFVEADFWKEIEEKDLLSLKVDTRSAMLNDPTFSGHEVDDVLAVLKERVPEIFEEEITLPYEERLDRSKWDRPYFTKLTFATVYKGNIIKNLIMDCQSYTKYRPNETTGGIFVSWRRKEELPTGA